MQPEIPASQFKIWGVDDVIYGPVDLPTLTDWVKDDRVTPETWIFNESDDRWQKATYLAEIRSHFEGMHPNTDVDIALIGVRPAILKRVKILSDLTESQLARLVPYLEVISVPQFKSVVQQGTTGDSMFFVLEGEVRVRLIIAGKESTLATLGAGEFFGEISLFDQGPRSTDVLTNKDSVLVKITYQSFRKLMVEAPDISTPFLFNTGKTLVARIRADNKRFKESVHYIRTFDSPAE